MSRAVIERRKSCTFEFYQSRRGCSQRTFLTQLLLSSLSLSLPIKLQNLYTIHMIHKEVHIRVINPVETKNITKQFRFNAENILQCSGSKNKTDLVYTLPGHVIRHTHSVAPPSTCTLTHLQLILSTPQRVNHPLSHPTVSF